MALQNTLFSPDFSVNKTSICITIEKWSVYGDKCYIAESNVNDSLKKVNYTFLCDALKGADNAFFVQQNQRRKKIHLQMNTLFP